MTSKEIAQLPFFISACQKMGVKATPRQARKAKQGAGKWKGHQIVHCFRNKAA